MTHQAKWNVNKTVIWQPEYYRLHIGMHFSSGAYEAGMCPFLVSFLDLS